jgi:hypothetical protein
MRTAITGEDGVRDGMTTASERDASLADSLAKRRTSL